MTKPIDDDLGPELTDATPVSYTDYLRAMDTMRRSVTRAYDALTRTTIAWDYWTKLDDELAESFCREYEQQPHLGHAYQAMEKLPSTPYSKPLADRMSFFRIWYGTTGTVTGRMTSSAPNEPSNWEESAAAHDSISGRRVPQFVPAYQRIPWPQKDEDAHSLRKHWKPRSYLDRVDAADVPIPNSDPDKQEGYIIRDTSLLAELEMRLLTPLLCTPSMRDILVSRAKKRKKKKNNY
jgi:hypothetical protein